ncbi:MAG: DUF5666 domain-containing protein [Pseudomonadales bacterium]|jgi:hypothetical protein|nr:DUF5666 domain-containing protein [Pseudomonadales bacterium]
MKRALSIAAITLALSACGGGAGDLALAPNPVEGIDRSGVTVGTVDAFGSIFVDGIRFDTTDATFLRGGSAIAEADLAVGLVVTVDGEIAPAGDRGVAERVQYLPEVSGPIEALDPSRNRFTVLGREVRTDRSTVFATGIMPDSVLGLALGDAVEISGFETANDGVLATRVTRLAVARFSRIGRVSAWDPGTRRFRLGGLQVDASAASLVECGAEGLDDGRRVEVEAVDAPLSGVLNPDRVRCLPARPLDGDRDDAPGRLSGLVTRFADPGDFDVNGQPVTTDGATVFVNGNLSDLAPNRRISVDGTLGVDGVLRASLVRFALAPNLELESRISSLPPDLRLAGFPEIEIRTDAQTQFEDETDAGVRSGLLQALAIGDFLEVKGRFDAATGILLASRIEREDQDDEGDEEDEEIVLDGILSELDEAGATVLGVSAAFTQDTHFAVDGVLVTAEEFLATAAVGDEVEFRTLRIAGGPFEVVAIDLMTGNDDDDDGNGLGDVEFEGPVTSIDSVGVVVDGQPTAVFDAATRYFQEDGLEVSQAVFLTLATPGAEVEVDAATGAEGLVVLRIELD